MLCLLSQPQGRSGFGAGAEMSPSPTSAPALEVSPLHKSKTRHMLSACLMQDLLHCCPPRL